MTTKDLAYYLALPYKIELIPEEDGTGFTAVIPDLKGCISFGETVQEAHEMISDAKSLWIETALDKGWPVPEPKEEETKTYSGKFVVRLPRSLHRRLAQRAETEGTSLNQLVLSYLAEATGRRTQRRGFTRRSFGGQVLFVNNLPVQLLFDDYLTEVAKPPRYNAVSWEGWDQHPVAVEFGRRQEPATQCDD